MAIVTTTGLILLNPITSNERDIMELTGVAKSIEHRIRTLAEMRDRLEELAVTRAKAIANYDLSLMRAIDRRLADGAKVTIVKDYAKGDCRDQKEEMELADALYRIHLTKMDAVKAELNGCQSIYKHMDVDGYEQQIG